MNPYGTPQLASAMRTVRKNTILVAEDIPEESYGYRVTPDRLPYSKAQIVNLLRAEGEKWAEFVERIPQSQADELVTMPNGAPSKSRFEMLQGTKEHEMHHRAQLMVVERLLGVVPHLTRNRRPAPVVAPVAAVAH